MRFRCLPSALSTVYIVFATKRSALGAAAGVSAPLAGCGSCKLEHHRVDIIIGVALSHLRTRSCSTVTHAIASGSIPKLCIDSRSASRQTAAQLTPPDFKKGGSIDPHPRMRSGGTAMRAIASGDASKPCIDSTSDSERPPLSRAPSSPLLSKAPATARLPRNVVPNLHLREHWFS